MEGNIWKIPMYGMNDITSDQPDVDREKVCEIFGIDRALAKSRPKGKVLIETD